MKNLLTSSLSLLVVVALAAQASAQCSESKAKAEGAKAAQCETKGKSCCPATAKTTCHGADIIATGMPLLHYNVGDKSTPCPAQARELAGKCDSVQVRYVLNDQEYECRDKALAAYAAALKGYYENMTSVSYAVGDQCVQCPMAAQSLAKAEHKPIRYRLASFTFDDKDHALNAARQAREAAEKVTLKLVIDGKEYDGAKCEYKACGDKSACTAKDGKACCGKAGCEGKATAVKSCDDKNKADGAKQVADAGGQSCCAKGSKQMVAGKSCEYVVGDTKTTCAVTAEVELAQARIQAAHSFLKELTAQQVAAR